MKTFSEIPYLGNGIGFRPELKSFIYLNRDKIDFVEVIADHYMDVPDAKWQELVLLKKHFTVIPHALDLSLGSEGGPDAAYVKKLAALVDFIDPPYWSEHVAYTRAHGIDLGHLAPLVYDRQLLKTMTGNIRSVCSSIKKPLILENITYHVQLGGHEYTDAVFLNLLCEATGCGLLLDITNLYINSHNFNFDPFLFIDGLNPQSVVQLHYVGYDASAGQVIDTHAMQTQEEIFALMAHAYKVQQPKGALLERDERYHAIDEITADLTRAKNIMTAARAL